MCKTNKNIITIILFLLPSLLGLIVFNICPMVFSFVISLSEWNMLNMPVFSGIQNYLDILHSKEFWRTLGNTSYFITVYIPLILGTSVIVATILNNSYKGIKVIRVLFFIPYLTSWVAGALVWKWLLSPLNGPVNAILGLAGINGPGWLSDGDWAMAGIALASVWKDMGFFGLILLGGMHSINPSYYEAAQIDGANAFQKFLKITLPLLTPVIFFVVIICIINSFQLFPQVMIMSLNGEAGPYGSTQVMVERIYKYAFRFYKMGYASSYAWVLFMIIFTVTFIQFKLQKRWVSFDA